MKYLPAADTWRQARRRSREGAWIEIWQLPKGHHGSDSRSREGAWIEIVDNRGAHRAAAQVAPARERGLKSRCG